MFYAVILNHSKQKLICPENWVQRPKNRINEHFNFGISIGAKDHVVFYSPNDQSVLDFAIRRTSKKYDGSRDKYYKAKILYVFGKHNF